MQFHSLEFLAFFPLVYAAYWGCAWLPQSRRAQNALLLAASYVFYGFWDPRFLTLIALSTLIDFSAGLAIGGSPRAARRRAWLTLSVVSNLAILGFFKYWNFFTQSLIDVLETLGLGLHAPTLEIILPVGISFYTFQSMSYTIDVYRGKLSPTRSALDFAVYVAFFPQLVAGPIERGARLLPQFQRGRRVRMVDLKTGALWIALGYFLKVCLADTQAPLVDHAFANVDDVSGVVSLLAIAAFTIQIYCDFAGYSLIARGLARLFGISLMLNFRAPFLAANPRDFWRRWHISLSTWLRDYVYISMGGNRLNQRKTLRNLMVTMLLGGLWHGAAWNFVLWGLYHGILLAIHRALASGGTAGRGWGVAGTLGMAILTMFGFLLFRVDSPEQFVAICANVFDHFEWTPIVPYYLKPVASCAALALLYQWIQERVGGDPEATELRGPAWAFISVFVLASIAVVGFRPTPFLYFQF